MKQALAGRPGIPPMSDEEHALLAELIRDRFGLEFAPATKDRVRFRLRLRLEALSIATFMEYYHFLRLAPRAREEMGFLAEALTNGETFFLREAYQLRWFFDTLVPLLSAGRPAAEPIRVLSAGCSSGEEAYSLSIAWHECPLGASGRDCEIHAVDLNAMRIRRAELGVYDGLSFRMTPPEARDRYFTSTSEGFRVKEWLRKPISFRVLNLLEIGEAYEPAFFDAVFCRNVLIYFDEALAYKTLRLFHKLLRPEGALFLGHSESLLGRTNLFKPRRAPEFIYYVRALE